MIFIVLFLISFFPRIISLSSLPPSPNWDEVSQGYNAYSILHTAKDEWGQTLPLIFRAYGDYKLPLYTYLTTIPVAIFGLNSFAIRLISVLAGSLLPLVIFLILKPPTSTTSAFLTALIIALSPWSIFLSRIALEANLFLLLFFLSLYYLTRQKFSLSAGFYALSLMTYNSSRVLLIPYLIALFFSIHHHRYSLIQNLRHFLFPILLLIIVILQTLSPVGQARYQWVSLLDSGAINRLNQLRQTYPRLLVNKLTYFSFTATKNYLAHFHPAYVFHSGASHSQFNIPNFYLITPLLLPFLIIGFFTLKRHPLILFFLLISPLPSAITRDAPQILRSLTFLPLLCLIIGLGIHQLLSSKFPRPLVIGSILLIVAISQFQFWPRYQQYGRQYSSSWQYGYQQAIDYLKPLYSQYQQIVFTKKYGEPHEFLVFFWPWHPSHFQQFKQWDYHANWYWVNAFDKFIFKNDWEISDYSPLSSTLLVTSPGNYPIDRANRLTTINFLDGTPAFDIISYE